MSEVIIGVDLGGTQLRVARLDPQLNILQRKAILTEAMHGPDHVIGRMVNLIREVLPASENVIGIGISSPGPLNPMTGEVIDPPNLNGWTRVPLVQRLQDVLDLPVFIGNDASVAVLAEVARGAAQGAKHVIYITLSTGIGGGVLIDGRLLLGQQGYAAHIGHMSMVVDGGRITSLEKEAAGPALAQQARNAINQGRQSLIDEMVKGDLSRIDSAVIGQAAQQQDALALEIVTRAGRLVGAGVVTLLHIFNPEVVVIGGGVSKIGDLLLQPMHEVIKEQVISQGFLENLRIEQAVLGDDVSIIGAAALVKALEES